MNTSSFGHMLATFCLCAAMGSAQAALIVDTGEPYNPGSGSAIVGQSSGFQYQYLANSFTVNQAYRIQSITTHLQFAAPFFNQPGSYAFAVYSDSDGLPGARLFTWTDGFVGANEPGGWRGATSLDWYIDAGRYWVALEGPNSALVAIASGPGVPLNGTSAYKFGGTGAWGLNASAAYSLRVDAVSVVPEPSSLSLIMVGAIAMGFLRRRGRHRGFTLSGYERG